MCNFKPSTQKCKDYWRYMCHHLKFIMIYWDSLLFTRYSVQGSWILILPKSIIHIYCLRWLLPTIPVASCKWNQWSLVATSDSLQQLRQEGPIHLPSRPHVFLWGKASSILWTSKTDLLILKVLVRYIDWKYVVSFKWNTVHPCGVVYIQYYSGV